MHVLSLAIGTITVYLVLALSVTAFNEPIAALLSMFEKLIGLLLSAFAVSMGAPFWFDLLKNLMSICAVGKNLAEQNEARDKAKWRGPGLQRSRLDIGRPDRARRTRTGRDAGVLRQVMADDTIMRWPGPCDPEPGAAIFLQPAATMNQPLALVRRSRPSRRAVMAVMCGVLAGLAASMFAAAPAHAQETAVKFQLDWRFEGPSAFFLLPVAQGQFKAEKLKVTVDAGNGSGNAVNRVASGTYDMGFADLAALMEFHANNPTAPNKPVAVMMVYNNTPAAVFSLKKTGICSWPTRST